MASPCESQCYFTPVEWPLCSRCQRRLLTGSLAGSITTTAWAWYRRNSRGSDDYHRLSRNEPVPGLLPSCNFTALNETLFRGQVVEACGSGDVNDDGGLNDALDPDFRKTDLVIVFPDVPFVCPFSAGEDCGLGDGEHHGELNDALDTDFRKTDFLIVSPHAPFACPLSLGSSRMSRAACPAEGFLNDDRVNDRVIAAADAHVRIMDFLIELTFVCPFALDLSGEPRASGVPGGIMGEVCPEVSPFPDGRFTDVSDAHIRMPDLTTEDLITELPDALFVCPFAPVLL